MKRLAIFDFDGTLFDSIHDVTACLDKALKEHGFPALTKDEYIDAVGGNIDEIMSNVLMDNSTPENIELIKKSYEICYDKSKKDNTVPFPGVHDLLKKLTEKDVLLAINSNRSTDSIKYFVQKNMGDIDFLHIEGHNPPHPSKPDSYGVDEIIKKADVLLSEVIYIGDSETDIETAKNSAIDCIIVNWGYGNQNDYENKYNLAVIENPSEILNYF